MVATVGRYAPPFKTKSPRGVYRPAALPRWVRI
jgi:hypothetical protein